jgi:hypothetical protein
VQQEHVEVLGVQSLEGFVDAAEDVLLREVEIPVADAHLRLDDDRLAFCRGERHRFAEPAFAPVALRAVDVGVVEIVDSGVARGADERSDLLVAELRDPHQPEDDVRSVQVGVRKRRGLHPSIIADFAVLDLSPVDKVYRQRRR